MSVLGLYARRTQDSSATCRASLLVASIAGLPVSKTMPSSVGSSGKMQTGLLVLVGFAAAAKRQISMRNSAGRLGKRWKVVADMAEFGCDDAIISFWAALRFVVLEERQDCSDRVLCRQSRHLRRHQIPLGHPQRHCDVPRLSLPDPRLLLRSSTTSGTAYSAGAPASTLARIASTRAG